MVIIPEKEDKKWDMEGSYKLRFLMGNSRNQFNLNTYI